MNESSVMAAVLPWASRSSLNREPVGYIGPDPHRDTAYYDKRGWEVRMTLTPLLDRVGLDVGSGGDIAHRDEIFGIDGASRHLADSLALLPHALCDPALAVESLLERIRDHILGALVKLLGVGELLLADLALVHLGSLSFCPVHVDSMRET